MVCSGRLVAGPLQEYHPRNAVRGSALSWVKERFVGTSGLRTGFL